MILRNFILVCLFLTLSACASRQVNESFVSLSELNYSQTEGMLEDSVWRVKCTGTGCSRYFYMHLTADHKVGYSWKFDFMFSYDREPAAWNFDGKSLSIIWQNGDIERYVEFDSNTGVMQGADLNGKNARMQRLKDYRNKDHL